MRPKDLTADIIKKINSMYIAETIAPQGINVIWVRIIRSGDENSEPFAGLHHHTFCEVHICLEGTVSYEFGGECICAFEGEGMAVAPGIEHVYADSGSHVKCAIAFSADPESEFYRELQKIGVAKFNCSAEFQNSLNGLLGVLAQEDCFSEKLCAGFAFAMVHSVLKSVNFKLPKRDDNGRLDFDPRLTAAKKYIQSNRQKMLSCEDVARECGLSAKQLGRIFKKHMGQSLAGYIKEQKLKDCEAMLLDSRYTVKEVGFQLGFENEYYFNSFFKRHYGMPPGLFKKQNATAKQEE